MLMMSAAILTIVLGDSFYLISIKGDILGKTTASSVDEIQSRSSEESDP